MDLNFYSELSDGCPQTVDAEFLDSQAYGGYSVESKVRMLGSWDVGDVWDVALID